MYWGIFLIIHFSRKTVNCATFLYHAGCTGNKTDLLLSQDSSRGWWSLLLPLAEEMHIGATSMPSCVPGEHMWKVRWKIYPLRQTPGKQRNITSLPLAKAKPPPSSNTMFHGIFWWTDVQSKRAGGARTFGFLPKIQKGFVSHIIISKERSTCQSKRWV